MPAIITDQLRILNTKDFVASVASTTNSYYTWIGLPNATEVDSEHPEQPKIIRCNSLATQNLSNNPHNVVLRN